MKKFTFKRVIAYIMDAIFVMVLTTLIARIEFINPNYDEYMEKAENYTELLSDYYQSVSNNASELSITADELNDMAYDISKLSIFPTAIGIVITLLYYVVCQYYNNGSTLAMALFKIRVVDSSNKKPTMWQLLLRSVIIYGIVASMINVLLLIFASKANYIFYGAYVNNASSIIILACFVRMLFKKDGRGLHDLLAGTKVELSNTNIKEANIVEEGK